MKREIFKDFVCAAFCVVLFSGYAQAFVPDNGGQSGKAQGQAIDGVKDGKGALTGEIRAGGEKKYKDGELLVKFKKGISEGQKQSKHKKHHAKRHKKFKHIGVEHVKLEPGITVEGALAQYKADPDVEYVEPNFVVKALGMPNDPLLGNLWGLNNTGQTGGTSGADIKASQAWDMTTGSSDVVVTVIDTGIDYTHEDIVQNLWVNTGEIPGNGIDDDGNGYIDDVYGINTITGSGDPRDDHGHGTHCAGTIGAVGNNGIGVAGVNWNVKIMACKFLDGTGSGYNSDAAECLDYVKMMKDRGVNVVATSNSYGGEGYSQTFYDLLNVHMQSDILFAAAAGNSNSDNDVYTFYPSSYDLPNVVAVAATDHNDAKASFSSYGRHTVHVGAPGVDIVSLRAGVTDMYGDGLHFIPAGDPSAKYYKSSGTSMATPHVAGLAALIKSAGASRDWKAIKNLIISAGENVGSMNGITISGKRINAYGSLTCSNSPLFSVLRYPASFTIGEPVTLAALSINCDTPVGPVTATASTGEVIELRDDGVSPDLAAGDGIFTATWTPSALTHSLLFSSPLGSVRMPPPAITKNYLLEGNITTDYSQSLEVAGGMPPFSWSVVSGNLPPGLALDGSTGVISGRPTAIGKYSFRVQAADAELGTAIKDLVVPVTDHFIVEEWARIAGSGVGKGIVIGQDGSIYTAGRISNELGGSDFLTVKYDVGGNVVWQRTYRQSGAEQATGIALDSSDKVYVVGNSNNETEISVVSYDASGNLLWDRAITPGVSAGVAVDRDGNVVVAGSVSRGDFNSGSVDFVVVKLDRQGNEIWKSYYDNSAYQDDARGMAVDGSGNIYVTGDTSWFMQTSNGYDYLTVKFDSSGNVVWARTYNVWKYDWTTDIAVDSAGNVYVTGTQARNNFLTVKYDPLGNVAWVRTYYNGIASGGLGIAVDQYDNIYLSGYSYNGVYIADAVLIKYDQSGTPLWTKQTDRGNAPHYQMAIAVASDGTIYTTGHFGNDFLVQAYRDTSLHITASPAAYGLVNVSYSQILTAAGGVAPYTWTITSGTLPAGLVLDSLTGVLSGTPTQVGSFTFTAQVRDANAATALRQLVIFIYDPLAITTASLPAGLVSGPYLHTLTATGGALPYYWTLIAGSVPPGLTLNRDTGQISGVPTAEGTFAFTVRVTDVTKAAVDRSLSVSVSIDSLAPTTTASPPGGSYVAAQTIRLTTSETATIYCTTDGTAPVISGSVCNGSVTVSKSLTLKYFAVDLVGNIEAVKTAVYAITGGEARTWGANTYGQLGDGTTSNRLTPVLVNGLADIVSVASGKDHTVALKKDGTVWAWGWNGGGQIGDGTWNNRSTPVQVTGMTNVVGIAAGYYHSVALKSDGTVWAWGLGNYGQLGDGSGYDSAVPVQVTGLTDVVAISSGMFHTAALKKDGTVWGWGFNGFGQLGDGTAESFRLVPVQATGLMDIVSITCGGSHTAGVRNNGDVWFWGDASITGDFTNVLTPKHIAGIDSVVQLAGGQQHIIARKSDGTVWAWGKNDHGQLGNGLTWSYRFTPGPVLGLTNISAIASGYIHSLALRNDGTVWAWGNNSSGQLGNGQTTNRNIPIQVSGLSSTAAIAAGENHSIALRSAPLTCTTSSLPEGVSNYPYSQTLAASGGLAPYTWSIISGSLPSGLALMSATGVISGIPGVAGTFSFTMQVTDAHSATATKNLSITVYGALAIGTAVLPTGVVGTSYSHALAAYGGLSPYTWSIASGSLPAGLTINSSTGEISGVPSVSGTATFMAQVTDALSISTTKELSIIVTESLAITTSTLTSGATGTFYSQTVVASGGVPPYAWSITVGSLPSGLTLNGSSGQISGVPTAVGASTFTVQAVDANSTSASKQFTIAIYDPLTIKAVSWWIVPIEYPTSWSHSATGGVPPYTWTIVSGRLANGLTLDSATGQVSGTAQELGWFYYTLQVTDAVGAVDTEPFSFYTYDMLDIDTKTLPYGTRGAAYSQTVSASGGKTPYTWSVSAGSLPAGLNLVSATGTISGTPVTAGTYTFSMMVRDAHASTDTQQLSIVIYDPLLVTTDSLPGSTIGSSYNQALSATGGLTPYMWSIASGSLPAGLSLNSASGDLSGMLTSAGTYSFTIQVADANGSTGVRDFTVAVQAVIDAVSGPHGAITPSGPVPVNAGAAQTFTITPDTGYHVADVLVDGVSVGAITTYTFSNITANHTIGATFAVNTFMVTPTAGPNGAINPSTPQTVNYLESAVFSVATYTGYHIDSVAGCGGTLNGSTYTTGPVTADCTVSATFAINTYTVTPTAGPNGTISPSAPQTVNHLESAVFSIATYTGYHIDSVTGCEGTLNGSTYTTGPVTADCTVSATFAINTYTVTPTAGPNGTISPATPQTVNYNQTTAFTVTPNTGYHIALVSGCSGTLNGGTYTTGPVTADCTVSATFAINTYTVTPTAGPNGTISPSAPQTVNHLESAVFSIATYTGYHIDSVTGCGGTLNGSTYTTGPVTADCTVSATFAINTYTVTPTAGPNGTISPATPQTVNFLQPAAFTITPNLGYNIASVTGCSGTLNGSTYTTGPVTANCTVSASFVINTVTLTVTKAGTGTGTVTSSPAGINCGASCSATYNYNTVVTLTAAAAADSLFAGWSGGGCSGTGTCVTTMDAAKTVTATFDQYITVTVPNGGESWTRGATYTIRWNYAGNPGTNVKIELLKGGVVNRTITSRTSRGTGGSGSYNWKVPNNQTTGSNYTIRVTSTSSSNYKDTSNGNFTIQ